MPKLWPTHFCPNSLWIVIIPTVQNQVLYKVCLAEVLKHSERFCVRGPFWQRAGDQLLMRVGRSEIAKQCRAHPCAGSTFACVHSEGSLGPAAV